MPTEVTSLEQFRKIVSEDKYSVFDFWATWCGPCRMIAPTYEALSKETTDVEFYKVDVDAQGDIAQECGISAMPTFMVFKNGQKVDSLRGANPAALETMIKKLAV